MDNDELDLLRDLELNKFVDDKEFNNILEYNQEFINNGSDEISICLWFSITSNAIAFLNFFENFKAYFLAIK